MSIKKKQPSIISGVLNVVLDFSVVVRGEMRFSFVLQFARRLHSIRALNVPRDRAINLSVLLLSNY